MRSVSARNETSLPEAIVNPELQQLQWRDETEFTLLWHVEIIYEGNQVLASRWAKDALHAFGLLTRKRTASNRLRTWESNAVRQQFFAIMRTSM